MKLLLDENISRRILPLLEKNYPKSSQVTLLGLERSSDRTLWEYARENNFIIVTKDSDFHELSLLLGSPPKIIWLRTKNSRKEIIVDLLNDNKDAITALLITDISCIDLA